MPDLCTTADVKTASELSSSASDSLIAVLVTAASNAIQNRFGREFVDAGNPPGPTRRFEVTSYLVDLAPFELRSASVVKLHPELGAGAVTLTADVGYTLLPVQKALGGTFTALRIAGTQTLWSSYMQDFDRALLDITGTWGMSPDTANVPSDVRRATVLTVMSWLARVPTGTGELDEFRPDVPLNWAIPVDAYRLLGPFARMIV